MGRYKARQARRCGPFLAAYMYFGVCVYVRRAGETVSFRKEGRGIAVLSQGGREAGRHEMFWRETVVLFKHHPPS